MKTSSQRRGKKNVAVATVEMTYDELIQLGKDEYAEALKIQSENNLFANKKMAKVYLEKIRHAALYCGHLDALCELGERLLYPMYDGAIQADKEGGIRCLKNAAERGHGKAQFEVGRLYQYGWYGVAKNTFVAATWFRGSSYYESLYHLGYLYLTGDGVPKDLDEAKRLFILANDGYECNVGDGYNPAAFQLGKMYLKVDDGNTAIYWLKRAGCDEAFYILAEIYNYGLAGVERNTEEAVNWYLVAAGEGNPLAMLQMGKVYEAEKNTYEAVRMNQKVIQYFEEDGDIIRNDNFEMKCHWAFWFAENKIELLGNEQVHK